MAIVKVSFVSILFKPDPNDGAALEGIEPYRKNEKFIGIPIVVNDENFFSKSEEERQ